MARDVRKGSTDVLVVGAGVFGLSCAWACARRGMRVIVAEAERPGAGASGGVLGALSPHPPAVWSPGKRFRFEALLSASAHWAEVAAAGGRDPGYARIGRLIPLVDAAARARAEAQAATAQALWGGRAAWDLAEADRLPGWLAPAAAPAGVIFETLSARIVPRRAIDALVAALAPRGAEIRCGWRAVAVEDRAVRFERGRITARAVILACGVPGGALTPGLPGRGVKGQAALLQAAVPRDAPAIYSDGVHVVPQPDGDVAVGSTSEAVWAAAETTDALLDAVVARARALCPALTHAPVRERWAGLRPRAERPDPMLGALPGRDGVFVATGGFKTGFGLAHAVGEALADMVAGAPVTLPFGYAVEDHLAGAARSTPRGSLARETWG